jgi:uncharacterized membrane protein
VNGAERSSDTRTPRSPHRGLSRALIIVASLLAVVAIFSAWAERQALDTEEWANTSDRLLEDKEIRAALANFAVDELYANVNVDSELQTVLPKNFQGLAGPAASGLREVATSGAEEVLGSDRFLRIWREANAAAHKTLIDVVEDRGDVVSTDRGTVTLELRPLIVQVANDLGLGDRVVDRLPEDVGELEILKADQIETAQTIASLIKGIALVTALFTLALLGLAIYLRHGERWIAILGAGVGLIVAGLAVLLLRELAGNALVESLATAESEPAAQNAWSIGTSLLSSIAGQVILFGIFFAIAAWLASPATSAHSFLRGITPVLRDHPVPIFTVLGLAGLIWALTAVDSTRGILVRLILFGMALGGLAVLRRRGIAENPDAQMGDMLARARARVAAIGSGRARPAPAPGEARLDQLERLAALHERGALSEEEFAAEKAVVLAGRDD